MNHVGRLALTLVVSALHGCATLNTAGMSEHCQNLYNGCLNTCPPPPSDKSDFATAGCVQSCNDSAKSCR